MKKTFIAILTAMTLLPANAQERLVADGFYRVQNFGTKRYAYICDNTGSINYQTTTADMGAIQLDKTADRRFHDPGSVIYASFKGTAAENKALYDLEAQGTGVYKIINYYVTVVRGSEPNTYWVYEPNYNLYLWDERRSTYYDISNIGTTPVTNPTTGQHDNRLRSWSLAPVNADTDEYLGIAPDTKLQVGGKYYKPYYLAFAFDFASSGMKAYYVSAVKSDAVIISEVKGTVPAATPVIVECSATEADRNRVNLYSTSPAKLSGNQLSGNYFCYGDHGPTAYKVYDASTMRVLGVKDGRLCYVTDTEKKYGTTLEFSAGTTVTYKYCLNSNESYLSVPAGTAAELPVMTQAEYDALHPATKKGDVNGDGLINGTDAALLSSLIAAGKKAQETPLADINGDGLINGTDAALLTSLIAAGK